MAEEKAQALPLGADADSRSPAPTAAVNLEGLLAAMPSLEEKHLTAGGLPQGYQVPDPAFLAALQEWLPVRGRRAAPPLVDPAKVMAAMSASDDIAPEHGALQDAPVGQAPAVAVGLPQEEGSSVTASEEAKPQLETAPQEAAPPLETAPQVEAAPLEATPQVEATPPEEAAVQQEAAPQVEAPPQEETPLEEISRMAAPLTPPDVTVVIAANNPGSYLTEALQSVIAQTYPGWRILLIDDGSTEDVLSYVPEELPQERLAFVRLVENQGQLAALNEALERVTTPYFLQLDADDWLKPDAIQVLRDAMEASPPTTGLVSANMELVYQDGSRPPEVWTGRPFTDRYELLRSGVSVWPRFYRTEALRSVGGWPTDGPYGTRYIEDRRILHRLIEQYAFGWVNQVLFCYRRHDRNMTALRKDEQNEAMRWSVEDALQRWGGRYRAVFTVDALGWLCVARLEWVRAPTQRAAPRSVPPVVTRSVARVVVAKPRTTRRAQVGRRLRAAWSTRKARADGAAPTAAVNPTPPAARTAPAARATRVARLRRREIVRPTSITPKPHPQPRPQPQPQPQRQPTPDTSRHHAASPVKKTHPARKARPVKQARQIRKPSKPQATPAVRAQRPVRPARPATPQRPVRPARPVAPTRRPAAVRPPVVRQTAAPPPAPPSVKIRSDEWFWMQIRNSK